MNPELGENVLRVMSSGVGTDLEHRCHFKVRATLREEHRNLHFSGSEPVLQLEVNRTRQFGGRASIGCPAAWCLYHQPGAKRAHLAQCVADLVQKRTAVPAQTTERGERRAPAIWGHGEGRHLGAVRLRSIVAQLDLDRAIDHSTPTSYPPQGYSKCTIGRRFTRCPYRPTFIPYASC